MLKRRTKDVTVAQLDRVSGYEPEGRGFESLQSRHEKPQVLGVFSFPDGRGWPRGLGTAAPFASLQSRHEKPQVLGVFSFPEGRGVRGKIFRTVYSVSMEPHQWHEKWEKGDIAFHEGQPNSFLVKYFSRLGLQVGQRVFVPLCGKTRDIAWLQKAGCEIVGVELNESAVVGLFKDLSVVPRVVDLENVRLFSTKAIDIFVGDIFELSAEDLGQVDAVYDRAALVALPKNRRTVYTEHLKAITMVAPQLLITFQYDQTQMAGPPFSVTLQELDHHYSDCYNIQTLESQSLPGGLKGIQATESVSLLSRDNFETKDSAKS